MSRLRRRPSPPVVVSIGFALDERGDGVAYARIGAPLTQSVERLSFRIDPCPGLGERMGAYAAVRATAALLHHKGVKAATFAVEDRDIVADIAEHRALPQALTMPYVALRCALNRFELATVVPARPEDVLELSSRARAEVALAIAA